MLQQFINPTPLTRENFSEFGDVIEINEEVESFAINDGYTQRFHDLANVDVSSSNGRPLINIFRSTPLIQPIAIKMMERHPLSSQAFIPLSNQPYLVVVAPKGEFKVEKLSVFIANKSQGVNYHAGTWHHYCLALHQISDFLVVDRGGEGDNCDVISLSGELMIKTIETEGNTLC